MNMSEAESAGFLEAYMEILKPPPAAKMYKVRKKKR